MSNFEDKLKDFFDYYEQLNSAKNEEAFLKEFMRLKAQSASYKEKNIYPADSGQLPINRKKNRFKDIIPFEYTRVSLHAIDGVEGSDYVNANYVQDADGNVTYIAAQGPLPHTANDFWRMLWYHNIEVVLMACKLVEMAKPKCECYWPPLNDTKSYGPITVSTVYEEDINNEFVIRDFVAECDGESQKIRQYHYSSWPDHGRPPHPQPVIKMIDMMHEYRCRLEVPILVHCSAGCGRTGTIIAIDIARSMVMKKHIPESFSPHDIVEKMRKQRPAMVQAKEQYVFVFMAMAVLAKKAMVDQSPSETKIEKTKEEEESTRPYENCTSNNVPVPAPRNKTSPSRNNSRPVSTDSSSIDEKPSPVAPPRTKQEYENISPLFPKCEKSPPPVRPKPRHNGGHNTESSSKPIPPPKQQPSITADTSQDGIESQYSTIDMTQLRDKGPEIAVVNEDGKRAPLHLVEEELDKHTSSSVANSDLNNSRSILETIMGEVGDLLDDEEDNDPSPPPPIPPANNTSSPRKWSQFEDDIPPPVPKHTEASTHIIGPDEQLSGSSSGDHSDHVILDSEIYYSPTPNSIPMPVGGMSSSSPPSMKPPPVPYSPAHHGTPPVSTLPVSSNNSTSSKGSRLKIFKGLGKSKSEKRKPLAGSDIGRPTGMARSPSDHALSSPPRGHSPSPDHSLHSGKNYASDLGAPETGPANYRYTFPGEMGFGQRIPRPKGPRPEPPHWNVTWNSMTAI